LSSQDWRLSAPGNNNCHTMKRKEVLISSPGYFQIGGCIKEFKRL
jgi:hypothetical protein